MRNTRLAKRYARSIIGLAIEKNMLEDTLKDMEYLKALGDQSREFKLMLRSPIIKADKKLKIVGAVVGDKVGKLTKGFLTLLIKKGREYFLPEITDSFIAQYKDLKKIHEVHLSTAIQVEQDVRDLILGKVGSSFPEGSIDLHFNVKPELIGGFVLESGDMRYDASVRRDLDDIKRQFLNNEYTSKI